MAYAINPALYSVTELQDTLSGSPDYWTDFNSGTHSYASSQLTVIDADAGASRGCYYNVGARTARDMYYRFTWQYTADNGANGPVVFQACKSDFSALSVGMYINFATNTINARNGAGWTSTGVTLNISTTQEVEFVVDRDAGTYDLYFNGSLIGTYTIDTNNDDCYEQLTIGGGSGSATWTYVISDTFLAKDTLAIGPSNLKSRDTNLKANIKTIDTNPIANVKSLDTNT